MNTLIEKSGSSPRQEALEIVIAELKRSLATLQSDYRKAVSNLESLKGRVETDDLTRLLRRGEFMKKLHNLLQDSEAKGAEVCVLMIDVDHFKQVNDTHGHQTGDLVLERIAQLVRAYLREQDFAGRYGGEEIIVAVQASVGTAARIAERIRAAVQAQRMVSAAGKGFGVTLSVGVACASRAGFNGRRLIGWADEALYRAKRNGRNIVMADKARGSTLVVFSLEHSDAA